MKKLFIGLVLSALSISSFATVQAEDFTLTLSASDVTMTVRAEQKTVRGKVYPSLNSEEVIYHNFTQEHKLTANGEEMSLKVPVDDSIGARYIIALSKTNSRLIYYSDKLGNIGADLGEFEYNTKTGSLTFKRENVEKAMGEIYNKAMYDALKDTYKLYNLSLCAGNEVESDLVCTPISNEKLRCEMGGFEYKLTTDCSR